MLALGACALAQSQPPAPSPPESSQNPQSAGTQPETDAERNDTLPGAPTSAPNQPLPAQPQFVITQTSNGQNDEASANGWIALFTGLLVVVGGLQVWALIKQHGITKTQAIFARAQKRISNRQFIAAHRPRLVVREIELPQVDVFARADDGSGSPDVRIAAEAIVSGFSQFTGSFRVANNGETNGAVRLLEAVIYIGPRLPPRNPAIGSVINIG